MRVIDRLAVSVHAQRGDLFPWTPVFFGIGIALYFGQISEPSVWLLWATAIATALIWISARRVAGTVLALALTALGLCSAGFALAGWRAHDVAAPVLGWRYYGPVEGRVIGIDRSASDAVRLTLDQVWLGKVRMSRTPVRVRISLHGDAVNEPVPSPGARVMTTAHLSPPGGPVEPGGFDFQRHSWFLRLGGVGYTRVPVLIAAPPARLDLRERIFAFRMAVSSYMKAGLPGDTGGFAAAVTSGDRSGMGQEALEALRASNLAHLLAISGLHMGLLTGFVFASLRLALALIPGAALHWPIRSIAAGGALVAGAIYYALSGGNVATERAFIMAAVALSAVILNRRAISLRTLAVAAMIVLFLRPQAMLGPGFQMSFAATTALVAVFGWLRDAPFRFPRRWQGVSSVVLSSAVAGFATAPISAAHFNAMSHYGLLANVLSVPVMGVLVVPAAVLTVFLAPFGLAEIGLTLMGWGLVWILHWAEVFSSLPGARSFLAGPGPWVLPCLVMGSLFCVLWKGRARALGLLPVAISLTLWTSQPRPAVLIADTGGLVGIMTSQGRAVSRERGGGFVATNWLENDGDSTEQSLSYARWPEVAEIAGLSVHHITGKRAAANPPNCSGGILVSNAKVENVPEGCLYFGPDELRSTGALALTQRPDGRLRITSTRQTAGDRLWSQWPE